jgi:hypothetical protein
VRGSPLLFYVSLSARYIDPSEGFNVVVLLWWPLARSLAPPRPVAAAAQFNIFHAKLFYVPERHHTHRKEGKNLCVCREMEIQTPPNLLRPNKKICLCVAGFCDS